MRHLASVRLRRILLASALTLLPSACTNLKAQPAAATAPADRPLDAIMNEFHATMDQFHKTLGPPAALADATQRNATAPKAVPLLKHLQSLQREMENSGDEGKEVSMQIGDQFQQLLLIFGDADTIAATQVQATDKNPAIASIAKCDLMIADWFRNSSAADQTKALDTADAMVKASPNDTELCQTLMQMSQNAAATPELKQRAMDMALSMPTPLTAQIKEQRESVAKVSARFLNKPLAVTGTTNDGKSFTTADWKGKVVLVDFWATWCPLCMEEMPRVKKAYADYHGKGLEIVGVSNDYDQKKLTAYVTSSLGIDWPQLFDPKAGANQDWNPITLGYGIEGLPTMFLIDKQGIVKSVDAVEDFDQQIPKMLAE